MGNSKILPILILLVFSGTVLLSQNSELRIEPLGGVHVIKINDDFWTPKIDLWRKKTVNDVFDKFEGKYKPLSDDLLKDVQKIGRTRNAFHNFDLVAEGKRGIGAHDGPPWYDGLVYETIRGASDFLAYYPDSLLENKIDGYIDRIAAAQDTDPDGYIDTYTQLVEPDHRWGENGGNLRWQHDVYNAGMLFEAAVHYYRATGKTKLLNVAVKFANYMYEYMGPLPKHNVVPAHSGPEEAIMKLYWLFKNNPEAKNKVDVPVNEINYYKLAMFWIEAKGHYDGFPPQFALERESNFASDYNNVGSLRGTRETFGAYAQDSIPLFQQNTIEGHAVRATLFATGATTVALENDNPKYIKSVSNLWDNMAGKRMFVSGGVGAIAHDEKFGPDYFLPNDAYLETCAAVGAGFFSQRMNQLFKQGEYMDEYERVLYNGVLTGISLSGDLYTYQNPLNADRQQRWNWHGCPCCPPMFLKMISSMPDFIYSSTSNEIFVNLFIGSEAEIRLNNETNVLLRQTTNYPWDGKVLLNISPDSNCKFLLKIRIPGWTRGNENPFGLYQSRASSEVSIKINGKPMEFKIFDGYVTLDRTWKDNDEVALNLPIQPRLVYANDHVTDLIGKVAMASGPILYSLEGNFNKNLNDLYINNGEELRMEYMPDLLDGVNIIKGKAIIGESNKVEFRAIPYFAVGNLKPGDYYRVWIPYHQNQ